MLFVWEIAQIVIIAALIVIPIRCFLFQPFLVKGASMEPNFHNNDYLIIDEISYRFQDPQRGEVVVFQAPQNPSLRYIKRIVGIPGERIDVTEGKIVIYQDNNEWTLNETTYLPASCQTFPKRYGTIDLGEDEYFVLGDNRMNSNDSRSWGALPEEQIIGRVALRVLPVATLAKIRAPAY